MSDRSGPDLNKPEWARPLAPLPEWLDAVEQMLRRQETEREISPRVSGVRTSPSYEEPRWDPRPFARANRMKSFRKGYGLTRSKTAAILGYDGAAAIARIEKEEPVRRNRKRQQALVTQCWGSPITDRMAWLKAWRARLGITQGSAAVTLGYFNRTEISRIERRQMNPSWEKILVAIFVEQNEPVGSTPQARCA